MAEKLKRFFGSSSHSRLNDGGNDAAPTSRHYEQKLSAVHQPTLATQDISDIKVAGLQRIPNGTFVTTYVPSKISTEERKMLETDSFSGKATLVSSSVTTSNTQSHWKTAAVGRQYDSREELSPEDEDMWANLAM